MSSIEGNGSVAKPKSWGHWNWDPGAFGIVLCVIALACFIIGQAMTGDYYYLEAKGKSVSNGDTVDIKVPGDNKPVGVFLKQYLGSNKEARAKIFYKTSSYVEFEWLPQDGSQPFSAAAEFWFEKGRDSQGYRWKEAKRTLRAPFLVEKSGNYKINIKIEGDQSPAKLWVYVDDTYISNNFNDWGWWILLFGGGFTILTPYRRIKGFGLHKTKLDVDEEDD